MDTEVDPCDDFYKYSCGNWPNLNTTELNVPEYVGKYIEKALGKILLEESDVLTEDEVENSYFFDDDELKMGYSDIEISAKNYYKSCMDTENVEKLTIQPAIDFVNSFLGWNIREMDIGENNFDWLNLTAHLMTLNVNSLIGVRISYHIKTYDTFVPYLDIGSILINRTLLQDENMATRINTKLDFLAYVKDLLKLFGVRSEKISSIASEIAELEFLLAELSPPEENSRNRTLMTVEELHENITAIDWRKFLSILQGDEVLDSQEVVIYVLEYFRNFIQVLDYNSETTIRNYLVFRLLDQLLPFVDTSILDQWFNFHTEFKSRQHFCYEKISAQPLNAALSSMYLRRILHKNALDDLAKVVTNVDEYFPILTERSEKFDDKAKKMLIEEAKNSTLFYGIENKVETMEQLKNNFTDLDMLDSQDLFGNFLKVSKFQYETEKGKLRQSFNWGSDIEMALTPNAFYNPYSGERTIVAGIIAPPMYHVHFPKAQNFGRLGYITGHELMHAFDFDGIFYTANKKMDRIKFDFSTILNYFTQSVCLARQYNAIIPEGSEVHVDGVFTITDNAADQGGLQLAYGAYKKWFDENQDLVELEVLPNLNLTAKELFFVSFMQFFCDTSEPEEGDTHSPLKVRGLAALVNFPEFSEIFKCPLGSPMNPAKKCSLF